jgi:type I restriction enzyme S subunit
MSEWKETVVGEYADVLSGYAFKSEDFSDKGTPVLKIKNVASGSLKMDDVKYYPFEITDRLKKFLVKKSDILIAMTGSHVTQPSSMVGKVCRYNLDYDSLLNQRVGKIFSKDKELLNEDFIYYFFKQNDITIELASSAGGSANQANISPDQIRNLVIFLPPIEEQTSISNTLKSLDEKIHLLNEQNKTLEELSKIIFKEFSIKEKDNCTVVQLGKLGEIICGKTPSKKTRDYFGGNTPFIKIPDMHGKTFVFETDDSLTKEGVSSQENKTIPPKSICVSCIATVGLIVMNAKKAQTNQQINSIIPFKETYRYFIYLKMLTMKDELVAMASGGTATDNLNTGNFSRIDIEVPSEKKIEEFHNQVSIYFDKIYNNQLQVLMLIDLKNTILPKLMKGELTIKE